MSENNICKIVDVNGVKIGNNLPFILIAGPCQLESYDHAAMMLEKIMKITDKLGISFIFKTSFDKANRTSLHAKRGVGIDLAVKIFLKLKEAFGCSILTDVHENEQPDILGDSIDVLQIPAFLCRQTNLIIAAAKTGKAVSIKKGQFMAPWNMKNVIQKAIDSGNHSVMMIERGVCFGYNTLVNDMRALPIMAKTGYPVIFDATHSVQQPGAAGDASGGQREFIRPLVRAAVAVGVAGLYIETHQDPDNAPSDGPCMLPVHELESVLIEAKEIDLLVKKLDV